ESAAPAPPAGTPGSDNVWPDQAGIYTGDAPTPAQPAQQWPVSTKPTVSTQPLPPPRPTAIPPVDGRRPGGVERGDLTPILNNDGSGLPFEL
ncbi:hypothetical protein ABI084_14785, partial [Enterococcus faecium]